MNKDTKIINNLSHYVQTILPKMSRYTKRCNETKFISFLITENV